MTCPLLWNHALKKSVVLAVLVAMPVLLATVQHAAAVVPQDPMPHPRMAAINPLKPLVPPQLPSSASARLPRPHPLARLRTEQENKHAATGTP
jgi:hypothetical protein